MLQLKGIFDYVIDFCPPNAYGYHHIYSPTGALIQSAISTQTQAEALCEVYRRERISRFYSQFAERDAAMIHSKLTPICACFVCHDQAVFELEFRTGSKYVCGHCGMLYSVLFEAATWRETVYTDVLLIAEQYSKAAVTVVKMLPELIRPDIAEIDMPVVTYEHAMDFIYRHSVQVTARQKSTLTQSAIYEETYSSQRNVSQTGSASVKRSTAPPTPVGKKKSQADMNAAMAALFDKEF